MLFFKKIQFMHTWVVKLLISISDSYKFLKKSMQEEEKIMQISNKDDF